jgi:hypothetical protein
VTKINHFFAYYLEGSSRTQGTFVLIAKDFSVDSFKRINLTSIPRVVLDCREMTDEFVRGSVQLVVP